MTKTPRKPRKSREEQITEWLEKLWKISTTGSKAQYLNVRSCHVAVWEDNQHPGEWTWHIESNKLGDSYEEYGNRLSSEEKAKRAVLNKLADKLGVDPL